MNPQISEEHPKSPEQANVLVKSNPPITEDEKSYLKLVERIFWPLILIIILLIAGAVTWLIAPHLFSKTPPSSSTSPAEEEASSLSASIQTAPSKTVTGLNKDKLKPSEEAKPAPPPPEVYWSFLSQQLLELERERVAILNLLGQKSPPPLPEPNVGETVRQVLTETNPKILDNSDQSSLANSKIIQPDLDMSWGTVGNQVLELEQQREHFFTVLANKVK